MAPPRLVAVLGSVTPPGRLRLALEQALARAQERALLAPRLLDLAEVKISFADGRAPQDLDDDTASAIELLRQADAVLLATPVYRGSLTGALKNLLDHVPVQALRQKPTAIVAMGASTHHFLGAERHLRDVLAFFGATLTPTAAYLSSADFLDGQPTDGAAVQLDELIAGLAAMASALAREPDIALGPAPLAARHA
ncbi:MAG: NAD(P)H-dependent oxidoreductase [Solirubrobacteraceae bacterium]